MAKFCMRCGKQNPDSAMICYMCGHQLTGGVTPNFRVNGGQQNNTNPQMNINQQYNMNPQMNMNQQYNANPQMNTNWQPNSNVMTNNEIVDVVTPNNIIRIIAIILEIICFLPTFLVSCGSRTVKITAVTALTGYQDPNGMETGVDGNELAILLFVMPCVIFAICLARNTIAENVAAVITAIAAGCDVWFWTTFKSNVAAIAVDNECTMEATSWYTINLLLLIAIIALMVLILIKSITWDRSLFSKRY